MLSSHPGQNSIEIAIENMPGVLNQIVSAARQRLYVVIRTVSPSMCADTVPSRPVW